MKRVLVLGANPARQKTLFFKEFRPGEVNRALRMREFASGKGINFCRALAATQLAQGELFQFCGGENGRFLERELQRESWCVHSIATAAPTRICTTCLGETGPGMTELIEPSFAATPEECRALLTAWLAALPQAAGAALCGTLPTGTDPGLYLECARPVLAAGKLLVADLFRGGEKLLALPGAKVLKINAEELQALTGEAEVRSGLRRLFARFELKFAAITAGAGTAYAGDGRMVVSYRIPHLDKVVNPIGCGDTASAVLTAELLAGTEPFAAFQRALGSASANALSELCGSFDPAEAGRLTREIVMTREDFQ